MINTTISNSDNSPLNVLVIDNFDSFVFNLYQMLGELLEKRKDSSQIRVIRNNELTLLFHQSELAYIFGSIRIIFKKEVLKKLAAHFFPDIEDPNSQENLADIITETSNIIGNGLIGTLGNQLDFEIIFTPPKFSDLKFQSLYSINTTHSAICAKFTWKNKKSNIPGWIILDFGLGSQYNLMDHLLKL